jgi:cytochrome d ubiquinol oxidase subunit II
MELQDLWFWLICVLWAGYFVLEGFDFGVGMLVPALGRSKQARDELFETIGPLWDGNEVWLIVAVGATLAAFPLWYATMFSAFYLVVLLLLLLLILRIVSFEWRERSARPRWHGFWTGANVAASYGAPFLWGLMFANLLQGVPIDAQQGFTGNLADQLSPYSLFAGLAFVAIFAFHGATYLGLRTRGALLAGAQRVRRPR